MQFKNGKYPKAVFFSDIFWGLQNKTKGKLVLQTDFHLSFKQRQISKLNQKTEMQISISSTNESLQNALFYS